MKTVMIIDDELLVHIGLESMIDWEKRGYSIVAKARNGDEAIKLVDKLSPDILLVDISMPGMDGLSLVSHLKEQGCICDVIILTSYKDFDYAKEAIHLGVCDYIVKSELTPNVLINSLNKIKGSKQKPSPPKVEKNKLIPDWFDVLENPQSYSDEVCQLTLKKTLNYDHTLIVIGKIASLVAGGYEDNQHLLRMLQNLSNQVFDEEKIDFKCNLIEDKVVYIVNLEGDGSDIKDVETIMGLFGLLKRNIRQFLNQSVQFGISTFGDGFESFDKQFTEALIAVANVFFNENGVEYYCNLIERDFLGEYPSMDSESIKKMVDRNQLDMIKRQIEDFIVMIYRSKNKKFVENMMVDIGAVFLYWKEAYGGQLMTEEADSEGKAIISLFASFNELKTYVLDQCDQLIAESKKHIPYSFRIQKSIVYMKAHYNENISLTALAERVGVSKNYLSSLFKQEIGINFNQYLNQLRIDKSKELLEVTDMKIYEIAESVGFDSSYYFCKVFKESEEITCSNYRKLNYHK